MSRRALILIGLGLALVLGLLLVLVAPWKGTLALTVNVVPDQLVVDGETQNYQPVTNVRVSPGSHTVVVSKKNYAPFTGVVEVKSGKTVKYQVTLLANTPSQTVTDAIKNSPELQQSTDGPYEAQQQIYLQNKDWLVAKVVSKSVVSDPKLVVLHRYNKGYTVVLGPGTYFAKQNVLGLPADVQAAIKSLGYNK